MAKQSQDEAIGMGEAPRIVPPIHAHADVNVEYESEDMVIATIRALYRWLMPPPPHAKPEERHGWDRRLGLTVFSLTILYLLSISVEFDLVPWIDGFARESAISSISTQITNLADKVTASDAANDQRLTLLQKNSIEETINAKVKLRCLSTNKQVNADLTNDIRILEDKYWALTKGQGYPQPTCYEVGASGTP